MEVYTPGLMHLGIVLTREAVLECPRGCTFIYKMNNNFRIL